MPLVPRHVFAGRRCGASLLLAMLTLGAFIVPGAGPWLEIDRVAVTSGDWWRLLTGHVTHWSADHLLWDLAVFLLLAIWCEMRCRSRMLLCLTASALCISAGVWIMLPDLERYRGLSGLDTALFALLSIDLLRAAHRRRDVGTMVMLLACLAAFGAKVVFETVTGRPLFVDGGNAGMTPIPLAHLLGGAVGVVIALAWRLQPRRGRLPAKMLDATPSGLMCGGRSTQGSAEPWAIGRCPFRARQDSDFSR